VTGKYGALLLYRATPTDTTQPLSAEGLHAVGRQLCQHIVGMNPQSIGSLTPPDEDSGTAMPVADDESRLVQQEYMLDTTQTVSSVLLQNGLTVLDFVRYECGGPDVTGCVRDATVVMATAQEAHAN